LRVQHCPPRSVSCQGTTALIILRSVCPYVTHRPRVVQSETYAPQRPHHSSPRQPRVHRSPAACTCSRTRGTDGVARSLQSRRRDTDRPCRWCSADRCAPVSRVRSRCLSGAC
jgi:hypothetical protein